MLCWSSPPPQPRPALLLANSTLPTPSPCPQNPHRWLAVLLDIGRGSRDTLVAVSVPAGELASVESVAGALLMYLAIAGVVGLVLLPGVLSFHEFKDVNMQDFYKYMDRKKGNQSELTRNSQQVWLDKGKQEHPIMRTLRQR